MSGKVAPMGSLQREMRRQAHAHRRSDPSVLRRSRCVILEVYDRAAIAEGVPDAVAPLIVANPGLTFCAVKRLNGNEIFYLPIDISTAELESTYGNAEALVGAPAMISYYGKNLAKGSVRPSSNPFDIASNPDDDNTVSDISGIF